MNANTPTPAPLRPLGPLFTAADAGIITLPSEVLDLRWALTRLVDTPAPERPDEAALHSQLVTATVQAALAATESPDVAPLADARRARDAADAWHRVHAEAVAHLAGELRDTVVDNADHIITAHLQPALDGLIDELREIRAALAGHGGTPAELLRAPEKARKAFLSLDAFTVRWSALFAARSALTTAGVAAQQDEAGLFALVKNADSYVNMTRSLPMTQYAKQLPWRELTGHAWLLWFVDNNAEVWTPTPSAQDARFSEVFGARIAHHRQSLQRGAMAHAL